MVTRFRYTSREGTEVEVPDLDGLRAHVVSGRVTAETPLLDALTGEFGPAGTHEAYRFVLELASEGASRAPGEPGSQGVAEGDFPDVEITLAEPVGPLDTAELVERLRREREEEDDRAITGQRPAPALVEGASTTIALDEPDPVDTDARVAAGGPDDERGPGDGEKTSAVDDPGDPRTYVEMFPEEGPGRYEPFYPASPALATAVDPDAPIAVPDWAVPVPAVAVGGPEGEYASAPGGARHMVRRVRRRRRENSRIPVFGFSGDRTFYSIGLMAILVLSAAYLALDAQASAPLDGGARPRAGPDFVAPDPIAPRGLASRLAETEGIAFQHMVAGMDSLARAHQVFNVPPVWLEGRYLANAAAHPEVKQYWERYLSFVQDLRIQDDALFRRSFLSRMESLDVAQSVVSLRLAQALRRFEASQPLREDMYDHMEDLARGGLDLHDLMVRRAVDVRYTPADQASAVRDPFLEIYTEDEALQQQIYDLIDRIFDNLEALHGESRWTRDRLNDGVLQSIRATGDRGA